MANNYLISAKMNPTKTNHHKLICIFWYTCSDAQYPLHFITFHSNEKICLSPSVKGNASSKVFPNLNNAEVDSIEFDFIKDVF